MTSINAPNKMASDLRNDGALLEDMAVQVDLVVQEGPAAQEDLAVQEVTPSPVVVLKNPAIRAARVEMDAKTEAAQPEKAAAAEAEKSTEALESLGDPMTLEVASKRKRRVGLGNAVDSDQNRFGANPKPNDSRASSSWMRRRNDLLRLHLP